MLTKVQAFAVSPEVPTLDLDVIGNTGLNPIEVRDVDGLGPVKADINTTPNASSRGVTLTGTGTGARNIVLKLGLKPDWAIQTVSELRQQLYRYFMPEFPSRLRFITTHLPTCEIAGYVESVEPNIFAQDPEVQVSIICPDPDFVAVDVTTVDGVVGTMAVTTDIDYEGTAPAGFYLKVESDPANVAYSGPLTIWTEALVNSFLLTEVTIDGTQYFEMDTRPGSRYVQTVDDGVTNLLVKLLAGSQWQMLEPGLNPFHVAASEAGQTWEMTYFARFGGL